MVYVFVSDPKDSDRDPANRRCVRMPINSVPVPTRPISHSEHVERALWNDIREEAIKNPRLKEMLEEVKTFYFLTKDG